MKKQNQGRLHRHQNHYNMHYPLRLRSLAQERYLAFPQLLYLPFQLTGLNRHHRPLLINSHQMMTILQHHLTLWMYPMRQECRQRQRLL
ncbi:hypothetical protein P3T83_08705 [Pseudocitrobacter sp. 2023EL-00150]|uniref:hypothetical protein n=1 Tax=Pseudocitrobacter sp. 2023EL-00150 TaxID=3032322 RepID=UPI0023E36644|nr:hypothetical protein [Pseudocitrobacter sp. 2023EL-00150]MDF3827798.1 hypothetical protein [Pseudocitrobacter sp. 2023EL-00150]